MVIDLGLIDYERAYIAQKELVGRRRRGVIDDSVIFAEHHPVFTIGRAASLESIAANRSKLACSGISVVEVDRGGDITFHGPGQLVIYPVVDLTALGRDLHLYLRTLEEVVIRSLGRHSISGGRIAGKTGVWVSEKKIASIGIAAADWITYHGVSVNVNVDLRFFSMIRPCGMDVEITSMARILRKNVNTEDVKRSVFSELKTLLNFSEAFPHDGYAAMA